MERRRQNPSSEETKVSFPVWRAAAHLPGYPSHPVIPSLLPPPSHLSPARSHPCPRGSFTATLRKSSSSVGSGSSQPRLYPPPLSSHQDAGDRAASRGLRECTPRYSRGSHCALLQSALKCRLLNEPPGITGFKIFIFSLSRHALLIPALPHCQSWSVSRSHTVNSPRRMQLTFH